MQWAIGNRQNFNIKNNFVLADCILPIANCPLIDKTPLNTKAQDKSLCRIMRCGKIVIGKPKAIFKANSIQVFSTNKSGEGFNAKVKESADIWQVF